MITLQLKSQQTKELQMEDSIKSEIAACQSARKAVIGDRTSCSVGELESIDRLVVAQRGLGDANAQALRGLAFRDLRKGLGE